MPRASAHWDEDLYGTDRRRQPSGIVSLDLERAKRMNPASNGSGSADAELGRRYGHRSLRTCCERVGKPAGVFRASRDSAGSGHKLPANRTRLGMLF